MKLRESIALITALKSAKPSIPDQLVPEGSRLFIVSASKLGPHHLVVRHIYLVTVAKAVQTRSCLTKWLRQPLSAGSTLKLRLKRTQGDASAANKRSRVLVSPTARCQTALDKPLIAHSCLSK